MTIPATFWPLVYPGRGSADATNIGAFQPAAARTCTATALVMIYESVEASYVTGHSMIVDGGLTSAVR
jgi:hypothetical protein